MALDDIRTEVVKRTPVFADGKVYWETEKLGIKVCLGNNLDNYTDANWNTQYLRKGEKPLKGIIEHRGITQLKKGEYAGRYVITQEILKDGEKRRKSKRLAFLVTNEEALDYILFADHAEILERPRFFPLKALFYFNSLEVVEPNALNERIEEHDVKFKKYFSKPLEK